MNIAIIPARGGSKRIIHKNIRNFCGKPIIEYAIDIALKSKLFKHVIVTTDDDDIAGIAKNCGAETPFKRPPHLSDDFTPTQTVIAHALESIRVLGYKKCKNVCCIYPCAPFINIEDLENSMLYMIKEKAEYCFPVTEFPSSIFRALRIKNDGTTSPLSPKFGLIRTQDLQKAYYDAGQFYWGKEKAWLSNPNIHNGGLGYEIPNWRVVDIDTEDDWRRAEIIYSMNNK